MKVTRNIIRDLLPAYLSGEATEDTRLLVEEYFREDPEFERLSKGQAQKLESLQHSISLRPDEAQEKTALSRARSLLRRQRILFGLALTFTMNAILLGISFQLDGQGHVTAVHWAQFEFQRYVIAALGSAALVMWVLYFIRARRFHT